MTEPFSIFQASEMLNQMAKHLLWQNPRKIEDDWFIKTEDDLFRLQLQAEAENWDPVILEIIISAFNHMSAICYQIEHGKPGDRSKYFYENIRKAAKILELVEA